MSLSNRLVRVRTGPAGRLRRGPREEFAISHEQATGTWRGPRRGRRAPEEGIPMRRLALTVLATLALLLVLAPDVAGVTLRFPESSRGVFSLGVLGGLTMPTGQLARDADLSSNIGNSGLHMRLGGNYGAALDYYLTNHWALGLWGQVGRMSMADLNMTSGSSTVTLQDMVKGRTTMLGGYVKAFGASRGAWTPCAYAGLTSFHREATISRDALKVFPGMTTFDLSDSKLGFSGGAGFEYRITPRVGLSLLGSTHLSGRFTRPFEWSSQQTTVKNWNLNTLDLVLSYGFSAKN
jgi:hypothetical protein